jgi:hypothetical protein
MPSSQTLMDSFVLIAQTNALTAAFTFHQTYSKKCLSCSKDPMRTATYITYWFITQLLCWYIFRRMLADFSESNVKTQRDVVILLTGIPGSGKTSSVQADQLMGNRFAIYELQLATPTIAIDKVKQVLDAGLKPRISVIHILPEKALRNILHRCDQYGRGASIEIMARIQGGLPDSLAQVHARFGNKVELWISDCRYQAHPRTLRGWGYLSVLGSEGGYEDIKMRLHCALQLLHPHFSEAAHRSALGMSQVAGCGTESPMQGRSKLRGS